MEQITEKAKQLNSQTSDARIKFLMETLVQYLHDYVRETQLTTEEWMQAIQFLTRCGQASTEIRGEVILLSDILGVSALVDAVNNPKPSNATESSVLGPFYVEDTVDIANGDSIASPGKGEVCLVLATVKNTKGQPIEGAQIDVWETDGHGKYDVEYEEQNRPDMRGRLRTDQNGQCTFKCVRPVSYSVPTDGPVGELLKRMNRHAYRPAHIHFRINVPNSNYDDLVTALYIHGDPYENSDAVFGVKQSLVVDLEKFNDASLAEQYGLDQNDWLVRYNFVLTTHEETQVLLSKRNEN